MELCAPALIGAIFVAIQVILDVYKFAWNIAAIKTIIGTMLVFLLNALCARSLEWAGWLIVFIPFIYLSVIVGVVLWAFGRGTATTKNAGGNAVFTATSTNRWRGNNVVVEPFCGVTSCSA